MGNTPEKVYSVRILVGAVPVAWKLSTIEERRQDQNCLFRRGDYRIKGHNPEKLLWIRFPAKMFSVARKLSMTEERRQDQSCFFRTGNYRNKCYNPKTILGSIPGEDGFCTSEIKHGRRSAPRPKLFVSKRRLQKQRPETRETVLGSIAGEYVFCCSENRHDRRTAPRPKEEDITGTKATTPKTVLGSSPDKDGFYSS
jgi:hypothetical protein